jgi:hypothetical protein
MASTFVYQSERFVIGRILSRFREGDDSGGIVPLRVSKRKMPGYIGRGPAESLGFARPSLTPAGRPGPCGAGVRAGHGRLLAGE